MSLGNDIGKFMWNIGEQKEGFKFGEPWRHSDKALGLVIPILRTKEINRQYKIIEETKNIEIKDTGNIDSALVDSKEDVNVFIRGGVILAGDTQERATQYGVIIEPTSKQEVAVRCVHASKGIRSGAKLRTSEYVPTSVQKNLYAGDQGDTWGSVGAYFTQCSMGGNTHFVGASLTMQSMKSDSDDLLATIEEVDRISKDIEKAIQDIPVAKNQVGAIIFDIDSIIGFEVFDSQDSWKALHKKVIKKYGESLLREQQDMLFELKPEVIPKKINDFIEQILEADEKQVHTTKVSNTKIIDGKKIIGEYTQLEKDIIHLIAFNRNSVSK